MGCAGISEGLELEFYGEARLSGQRLPPVKPGHVDHPETGPLDAPAACSFPGEKARSWEALGEARPGQSSLSAGALRYRAWAQSWTSQFKVSFCPILFLSLLARDVPQSTPKKLLACKSESTS